MNYLIVTKDNNPFYTQWYEFENHYSDNILVVFDILGWKHTYDGINWVKTTSDHL